MTLMDLVASLKMDVSGFLSGTQAAQSGLSGIEAASSETAAGLGKLGPLTADLRESFKQLGIDSSYSLKETAALADDAYGQIRDSGVASAGDIQRAEEAAANARKAYQQSIAAAMEDVNKAVEEQGRKIKEFGEKIGDAGTALTATFTVPLAAIGAIGLKAGIDIDSAFDLIRVKTGETGLALDGLQGSFRTVFGNVASSSEDVATAIAKIHQRTGETGPALEAMATQAVNLARITGESLGPAIDSAAKAFNKWGVDVDAQSQQMDMLFTIAQRTGASFTELAGTLTTSQAPLKAIGLTFEQSAALVGLFSREGFNSNEILGALKASLGKFAKAGQDPAEAFTQLMTSMKNTDEEAARFMATQVVGARRATEFAEAVRSGRLDFQAFAATLAGGGDSINAAAKETDDFTEAWVKFRNNLVLALEPLGKTLFDVLNGLTPHLKAVADAVGSLAQKFGSLDPGVRAMTIGIGALLAIVGPLTLAFGAFMAQLPAMQAGLAATGLSFTALGAAAAVAAGAIAVVATGSSLKGWVDASNDLVGVTENLRRQTGDLEVMAAKFGVTVDRGNMSLEQYNLELNKAIRATPDWQSKLEDLKQKQEEKRESEERAKKTTEDHARAMLNASLAAQKLAEQHKALQAAVDAAKDGLIKTFEAYRLSKVGVEAVEAAMENLEAQQLKMHPEKAAEEFVKARQKEREEEEKNLEWRDNVYIPRMAQMAEQLSVQNVKMENEFAKAHEAMRKKALEPIAINVKLSDRLPEEVRAAIEFTKAVADAYKTLGITSTAAIEDHADKARIAYETIKNSGMASARDQLEAEKAFLKAQAEEWNANGHAIPEMVKERLKEIEIALGNSHSKMKSMWNDFTKDITGILKTFQHNVVTGIWDQIFGNNNNAELDKQARELQASLAERTQEWRQYQIDVQSSIEEITRSHAAALAEELAQLQGQMAEKAAEWEQYQIDAAAGLAEFTAKQDAALKAQQDSLIENLAERAASWEQYQIDAAAGLAEFTAKQDAALAEELAKLEGNLGERAEAWQEYQEKAAKGLAEFIAKQDEDLAEKKQGFRDALNDRAQQEEEYRTKTLQKLGEFVTAQNEKLQEEQADLRRSLADKAQDYTDYVSEVNEKLARIKETSAEKLAEDIERLKKSFEDKRKAYEDYVGDVNKKLRRIGQDLAEQVDDEKRDTQRRVDDKRTAFSREERDITDKIDRELAKGKNANMQTVADLRKSLDDKRADLDTYLRRAEEDLVEFTDDHQREAEQQTADLKEELVKRQQAQRDAAAQLQANIEDATSSAQIELLRQQSDLAKSLASRTSDWQEYQAEIARKLGVAQQSHDEAIAKEQKAVADSLVERGKAWVQYQAGIAGKIDKAQKDHDAAIEAQRKKVEEQLAEQSKAWEKYQAEIAAKVEAAKKKHDEAVDAQTKKVTDGLSTQQLAWEKYQEEIARKLAAAQKKHDEAIEAETLKVQTELAKKEAEYVKYLASIKAKMDKAREDEATAQAKEIADLQKNLADKKIEYDKYVAGVNEKMEEIRDKHVTLWDAIGQAGLGAIQAVGEALTNLALDLAIDELKKSGIGKAFKDAFKGIGEFLVDAFSGAWGAIKKGFEIVADFVWDAVKAIGKGIAQIFDIGTGAASTVAGGVSAGAGAAGQAGGMATINQSVSTGLAGIVTAVSSVVTAITGIIGIFQAAKQETTLNAIEESTRYSKGYLLQLDEKANRAWPNIEGTKLAVIDAIVELGTLHDIFDKTKDIHSAIVVDVKNVLIDIKDYVRDQVLKLIDIHAKLGEILTASAGTQTATQATAQDTRIVAINSAAFDTADIERLLTTETVTISGAIAALATSIAGQSGFGGLYASLGHLSVLPTLSSQFTGLSNSLTYSLSSMATSLGNLGTLSTMSSQLATLTSGIYSIASRPAAAMTAAPSINNVYINGTSASAATTNLAATLRTYGIYI